MHRFIGALLVTLTLALAPAPAAQASLSDCFEALAPFDKAAEAAKASGVAAACVGTASGDPVMAMIIAAMTTSAIGGAFSTVDECNQLVNDIVGQMIAEALLSLDKQTSILGDKREMVKRFVEGNAGPGFSFVEFIRDIVPTIDAYLQCGCNVAGLAGELERLANEYVNSVEGCGNLIGDAGGYILDKLGDLACEAFCGHDFVPGIQMEADPCYKYFMPAEIWTTSLIKTPTDWYCNQYLCPDGLVIVERTLSSGQVQYKCSADCSGPTQTVSRTCYGTDEWKSFSGRCKATHTEQCCAPGEKVATWGVCESACSIAEYYDRKTKNCLKCPPGQTNALTECTPCPRGQVIWNFDKPGTPRPPAQVTISGQLPPSQSAAPGSQSTRVAPGAIQSPPSGGSGGPGGPVVPGSSVVAASPTGPIIATEAGKCVPCPQNWIPVYHSDTKRSSLGHCQECPRGTYADIDQCKKLDCPGGIDPKNPHMCLQTYQAAPVIPGDRPPPSAQPGAIIVPIVPGRAVCPQGTRLIAGSCVAVQPPPKCPPGMVPNPRGPGCIPGGPAVGAQPVAPPSNIRSPAQAPPQVKTQQSPPPSTLQRSSPPAATRAPPCPPGLRFINGQCVR